MTPANEAAFLVAFAYIAAVLGVLILAAHFAGFLARATRGWFGDDAELPEAELLRRESEPEWAEMVADFDRRAEMHENANYAARRTARTRHRMTREAWERATGKDIA